MGLYLFGVQVDDPFKNQFFIVWHNNIEIDDTGLVINLD